MTCAAILEFFEYIYFNLDLRSSKISPSFSIADAAVWQYALIAFQFNGKFQKQKSFSAPSYNNDSLVSFLTDEGSVRASFNN